MIKAIRSVQTFHSWPKAALLASLLAIAACGGNTSSGTSDNVGVVVSPPPSSVPTPISTSTPEPSVSPTPSTNPNAQAPENYRDQFKVDAAPDPQLPMPGESGYEAAVDASRLLTQGTFGPTAKEIIALMASTPEAWIDQQIATEQSLLRPLYEGAMDEIGIDYKPQEIDFTVTYFENLMRSDMHWLIKLRGEDQLRQRMALALSELLVVSNTANLVYDKQRGMTEYHDMLARNAFGNYRNLLLDVTLSPIMGQYLSHFRNQRAQPENNIRPDENFAREILQLFSIGLYQLNDDGSYQLDAQGNRIPTYGQDEIKAFARVFTGLSFDSGVEDEWKGFWEAPHVREHEIKPMRGWENYHDKDAKTLLNNVTLPANQTTMQDVEAAIDNIFEHSNVPPFISKQLIQRFVTSNPSAAYVTRVVNVFKNDGNGVRGNLAAVIKAILLDDEARNPPASSTSYGKLKEPLLRYSAMLRALKVNEHTIKQDPSENRRVFVDLYRIREFDLNAVIGQQPYGSPSVFNYFQPQYSQPGAISDASLLSPEFQILNESFANLTRNKIWDAVWYKDLKDQENKGYYPKTSWGRTNPPLDLSSEFESFKQSNDELLNKLNLIFFQGNMTAETKDLIKGYVNTMRPDGEMEDSNVRFLTYEMLHLALSAPGAALQR